MLLICLWILSVSSFSIFLFCLFVFLSPYQAIRTWWWERTSTAWRTAASSATWVTPTPRLTWSVAVFPESHLTYFCKKHSLTPVHLLVSVLVWPPEVFPQKSNSDWMLFVHYQASVPVCCVCRCDWWEKSKGSSCFMSFSWHVHPDKNRAFLWKRDKSGENIYCTWCTLLTGSWIWPWTVRI